MSSETIISHILLNTYPDAIEGDQIIYDDLIWKFMEGQWHIWGEE